MGGGIQLKLSQAVKTFRNRNLLETSLGMTYKSSCEGLSLSILYDGQFGVGYWAQSGSVDINLAF